MKRIAFYFCFVAATYIEADYEITVNNKSANVFVDVWENCGQDKQPKLLQTVSPSSSKKIKATQNKICFYGHGDAHGVCTSSMACYSVDSDTGQKSCDCGVSSDNPTSISDGDIIDVVIPPNGGPSGWKITVKKNLSK